METFILAAVSLIIAASLILYKKNDPVQLSFATFCLAIFVFKISGFFQAVLGLGLLRIIEYGGFIAIPPFLIRFLSRLLNSRTFFSRHDAPATFLFGVALGLLFYTSSSYAAYLRLLLASYVACVLIIGYLSLLSYIRKAEDGKEKRRLRYLAMAVPVAALFCSLDIFYYLGFDFPPLSNLVLAALLYFTLLIIAYPHLTELHDLMAKALLVSVVTAFAVVLFYLVIFLFGHKVHAPFTQVLVACFTIVISISPFKILLEKIFKAIYPESKDVFTSLYALDAKLEKERALLLEEMAPVFAHEIRNPLGSIKGAAQYLRSEVGSEENRKLLEVITEEVDRLNSVVSQFLDYAKPHMLSLKEKNINDIIDKAVTLIKASDSAAHFSISTDLHPALPILAVDEAQITQVILNLALNAIDAMPAGGNLAISTEQVAGEAAEAVDIFVSDTGKGVKQEDIKNIFKPFFTTKERGVGLGLAVCQRIIRTHGGSIRVKSSPGQGTTFSIRLKKSSSVKE